MSKDKGSTSLWKYFISIIVILFLGLLYLFLSGSLSFSKESWLPRFTIPAIPFSDASPNNNTDVTTSSQTTDSDHDADTTVELNLPPQNSSDSPQQEQSALTDKDQSEQVTETTPSEEQQNRSNPFSYKLPDGTEITIVPNTFAHKFQQAIEHKTVGKPIIFDHVSFASGSDKLTKQSYAQISSTAALLNTYKNVHIAIRGHSDNKGSSKKNTVLSLLRSGSMKKALIKLGIDQKRIQIEGVGDQEPIASNKTKRGRRNNRRIDLIIKGRN